MDTVSSVGIILGFTILTMNQYYSLKEVHSYFLVYKITKLTGVLRTVRKALALKT